MRTEDYLLTCRTLRSTPVWSLLALAALLPGGAAATAPSADDLWDISQGTVVTATSGIRDGFAATDMFGDTASSREVGNTVFSDDKPAAFTHYIEWQTVAPVTVGSLVLFAGGDGPVYFNEREFDRFVLKAKTEGAVDFDLTLYDYSPPHPYPIADAAVDPLLVTDILRVSARSFRAEFTQYTAGRGYDGPRIVELDAFPPPPSGPSTNDLWDVRQGTVVVATTGIRGGFAAADMFGDHASAMEPGNTVFSDDQPAGFVHSIEWQTVAPVAVGSFALYAGGDGPVYYNEREFDRFVLKAKPPGAADFNVILCDFTPPHPYPVVDAAQDPLLVKDITSITAQSFRAEFVQYTAGRGYDGPRVVELDAFPPATPPPPPFNLATNGSFELPPGIVTYRVFTAGTGLPGWIVEQGTVEIVGPYWQAAEGFQSLDLNGIFEHIGTISHPVSTAPGQRYKVRFAYAGNPEGGPAVKTTKVFWDDSLLADVSFDTTGHSLANMGWVYYEYEVTAASTSSLLKFQSTTPSFCGPALDDVSITLLDEPPPPPQCVPAPAGLVAWWPAEGSPADAAGENDGTVANGLGYATGKVGQAFALDGEDDEVLIPASPSLNVQSFTLETWINPADVSTQRPVLEWCAENDWAGVHLWISVAPPLGGGSLPGTLYANLRDVSGGSHVLCSAPGLIPANQWSHVALSYDAATGRGELYLNGASVAAADLGLFTPKTQVPLHIGRRPTTSLDSGWILSPFAGQIDEASLYSRALSMAEIQAAFAAGSGGKCVPSRDDGIPDAWREQHFGPGFATDPRAAATADPDSDGANNYREFLDGTDPLSGSSVKRVPLAVDTYAGSTRGAQDGFRTEARFNELFGMAMDRAGRLWLPECRGSGFDQPGEGFHRIRLLDTQGMVSVLSGAEAGLVDGSLEQARFSGPFGVVFDSAGNAFVLDMFNHRIRRIQTNGVVSTFAGSTRGYRDGPAPEAQFDVPHGIAIDAQDNLFIADWFNLRIRKITPHGEVTTFSGSTRGAQDGPRLEATYDGPVDVIVSPGGVIYVSDWANGRIRRIDANGDVTTFAAGLPYTETLSSASDGGVYCYVAGSRQLNRYSPNGELAWSWGAPEGSEDGPIGVARFGGRLTKVIELADGNLLVGDDVRIRLITMGVPPLVTFNPAAGPFMNPIEVTLTTVVPNGVIRFTIDGSEPTAASPAYASPVLLTASTVVRARVFVNDTPVSDVAIAEFTRATGDQEAPAVTITSPAPGATDHEYIQLSGTVTDNVGVVAVRLEREGQPPAPLELSEGQFLSPVIRLHDGENRLRVIATDAAGNEGSAEVLLLWTPIRTLFVASPRFVSQEGQTIPVPIKLVSNGDVGGLTFVVRYNTEYLRPLDLEWIAAGESSLRQVNLDVAGEIRATFALMGAAVPAGTSTVATAVFRARSVPNVLSTALRLELLDVSNLAGNPIGFGNQARSGSVWIHPRRIIGDNNANQRLDTGDATAIQRLLAALDPMRDWDRTGNDLNQNAQLDSGDVVRVLRAVVGLDPQPVPAPGGKTGPGAPILGAKSDPGVAGSAVLSADRLRGQPGDQVTVQVRLQDVPVPISGAAFTLEYSTNALRLVDRQSHRLGGLVAGNTLAMWNAAPPQNDYRVQPGRVSLGLSSATAWPESNGVLAEFTFEVQPGQNARYCWPVRLSGVEITSAQGLDIAQLPDAQLLFIGRDPIRPNLQAPTVSASGDSVQLRLVGEPNVPYVIEASSDLKDWTPIGALESPDGVLNFTDPAFVGSGQRFYRLRQE